MVAMLVASMVVWLVDVKVGQLAARMVDQMAAALAVLWVVWMAA